MTEQIADEARLATGRAIRRARERRGVTLRALAASLGVSPATMSAVENGHTPLAVERLRRIAEILDVSSAGLLRGDLARVPEPEAGVGDWRHFGETGLDPVLAASVRLFVRLGFHATSMREIAGEAGLSVAGVYHHYPSKQALLVALMDVTMAEIRWRVLAARDEGATPRESLALMIESLALFHAQREELAFIGASETRGIEEPDASRMKALRSEVQHLLDEQASVVFPGADVRITARAVATMCTSLPSWFRPGGQLTAAQVARRYAELGVAMFESVSGRTRPD